MSEAVSAPLPSSICVFCGARFGIASGSRELAADLGELLAREKMTLVYGGGGVGLMGVLANAALKAGGQVVGVIPRFLLEREAGHPALTETVVVENMHERKLEMFDRCDAIVVLPGGLGTLEELLEMLTWSQLGIHDKPLALLNVVGYWDALVQLLDHAARERFVRPEYLAFLVTADTPGALLDRLTSWNAPTLPRAWLTPAQT